MTRERLRRVVRTATAARSTARPFLARRPTPRRALGSAPAWLATLCGLAATQTHAAGGHHSVDDAAILDPGQCQIETWGGQRLVHLGPACRVGPVELGLNLERERTTDGRTVRVGPQIKWAFALTDTLSAGVLASATWQRNSAERTSLRFTDSSLVIPVTWQFDEQWRAHFNLGRDFHRAQPSTSHSGAALEWAALPALSLVAERFREGGRNAWRAGLRWTATPSLNVDLSHARDLRHDGPRGWTLGLTWAFAR